MECYSQDLFKNVFILVERRVTEKDISEEQEISVSTAHKINHDDPVFLRSDVIVLYFDLRPGPKMLFQGDTPEGSDTFQWPKRSRGRIKAYDMGQGEGPIVPLQ